VVGFLVGLAVGVLVVGFAVGVPVVGFAVGVNVVGVAVGAVGFTVGFLVGDTLGVPVVGAAVGTDMVPARGTCTATLIITTMVIAAITAYLILRGIDVSLYLYFNIKLYHTVSKVK